jgi:hypothetical protein
MTQINVFRKAISSITNHLNPSSCRGFQACRYIVVSLLFLIASFWAGCSGMYRPALSAARRRERATFPGIADETLRMRRCGQSPNTEHARLLGRPSRRVGSTQGDRMCELVRTSRAEVNAPGISRTREEERSTR